MGYGADFSGLSRVAGDPPEPQAMPITEQWFRYFLTQDPNFDWKTIDYDRYEQFWDQSQEEFGAVIGTDNPDLSAFRDHGGKIVLWHGLVDQLIYPGGKRSTTTSACSRRDGRRGGDGKVLAFLPGPWGRPLRARRRPTARGPLRRADPLG
ncbi:MAG: tannase/feruloyl esterase family alpha/beta hydrolase [Bryobacterales bacterium]